MKSLSVSIYFFLFVSSLLFLSCNGSAKRNLQKEPQKKAETDKAVTIADDIKKECVVFFNNTVYEQHKLIAEINEMNAEQKAIPAKFFMPLNVAERAQSNWQKAQVFGFLDVDRNVDFFVFDGNNNNGDREANLTSLASDLNFQFDANDLDGLSEMSREEAIKVVNDYNAYIFAQSLDNDNADLVTVSMAYSIIESTICQIGVTKILNKEFDSEEVFHVVIDQVSMLQNFIKLYNTILPYYDSLRPLNPIIEKLNKVANAPKGKAQNDAIAEYVKYANEMRDHVLAEFNLVIK